MTDAELRYLIAVNDRDVKEAKKNLDVLNKAIGKETASASTTGSRGLDRFGSTASKTGGILGKLGKAGALAAGGLAGGLAGGAVVAGKRMIELASDAAEVDSKFRVTFGRTSPMVIKQLNKFSEATGASRYQLKQQAADMGALLRPMLGNQKAAASMSVQTVKLATDLSSFNNIPVADALEKIRAGLVGEAEPLRSVGVLLSEAAVKQEAYRSGIAKQGATLTEQQKVQARYNLIMQQTALAQGDATRTSGSMANQLRALQNNVSDTATDIGMKLIPIALKAVQTFNAHWPEIQRVAGIVFRAIGSAWTQYLQPALRAIGAAIVWLVGEARRYWPQIQQAAANVMQWYRTNLQPTIAAVIDYLERLWQRFGGNIVSIAKAALNVVTTVIRVGFNVIKDAVEVVLALISGDWGKAWNSLKKLAGDALRGVLQILKALGALWLEEAKLLGKAIIDGIVEGVKAGGSKLKDALVGVVKSGFGATKLWGLIRSPSQRAADEIGYPISAGLAQGILAGKVKITDALVSAVDAAFNTAQTKLGTTSGRLSAFMNQAFGIKQGGAMTPTEKKIAALEAKRQAADLAQAVTDAQQQLADARANPDATPADIAAAQKALDDAKYQQMLAGLQQQAAAERAALEQRQFIEQTNFNQRLAQLQTYLESGTATTAGATKRIKAILHDFHIDAGDMGALAGKAFAQGLRNSIPDVIAASVALTTAAKTQQAVQAKQAATSAAKKTTNGKGGSLSTSDLVSLGRELQAMGFDVGENPAFGGVTPGVHAPNSYHYRGRAIDVNWPGGGATELSHLQSVYNQLRGGPWVELLLEDIGTANQHMHVALARGGILPGSMLGDSGAAGRRREAVLPLESSHGRRVLSDAFADALDGGGNGPLVYVAEMHVRDETDAQLVASAVNRAMGIR